MSYLLCEDGKKHPLDPDRDILIGRNPASDVSIKDDSVSRAHAKIYQRDTKFIVEDCGSRNGTMLNGTPIHEPVELQEGDLVEICGRRFRFRDDNSSSHSSLMATNLGSRFGNVELRTEESGLNSVMIRMDAAAAPEASLRLDMSDRKLQALLDIARSLGSTVRLEDILNKILECLFELFDQADRGFIILKNEDEKPVPYAMKLREGQDESNIHISRTIVDHVMQTGQALISTDAMSDSRFDDGESIAMLNLRSIMCAPLLGTDGKTLGLIKLDSVRKRLAFQDDDLELLMATATHGSLAIEKSKMVDEIVESAKLKKDLETARQVQISILPDERPVIEGFEFYDYYRPAIDIGGDHFDYIPLDDGRFAIVIADVVGHGIAAALLMSKLSSETRMALRTERSLSRAMQLLNLSMLQQIPPDKFITMAIAVLDPEQNRLQVVNAAHPQLIIRRSDASIFEPDESKVDVPLGIIEGGEFEEYSLDLAQGDVAFMFTDGLFECVNGSEEEFSIKRVKECLSNINESDPSMVAGNVISAMQAFVGDGEPFDDVCVVAFGRQ